MTNLEQVTADTDAAVDQLLRRSDWPELSNAAFNAVRATARAAYTQGRLDQAIKAARELIDSSCGRTLALAEESQKMADDLKREPDLHEVSCICVQCGTKSVRMSRDPSAPAEVRGLCSRCLEQ